MSRRSKQRPPIVCRYCGNPAVLKVAGDDGYPYEADHGPVWRCVPCLAHVGCHPDTQIPLGALANAELRNWKHSAHLAFDPLWQGKMRRDKCSKSTARQAGYRWLSEQMGIAYEATHIGMFDVEQCQKVVDICNAIRNKSDRNRTA